ncbi:phasin family protein [Mangrovitalea sediminis]|uniref:phasin family protein n=1 Tax=Mangrovitalea sediminis TaxID=1982043 RepID=UPI000BE4D805|nr:phasin family protein [Mangrovitalea sediminis]
MTKELLSDLSDKSRKLFEQAGKLNQLMMTNVEKAADVQMQALRAYTDLALRQARQLGDIRDAEGLKAFINGQSDVVREVSDRMAEDWQSMQELATKLREDFQGLIVEAKPEAAKPAAAKPAAKPKAKAAPKKPAAKKPATKKPVAKAAPAANTNTASAGS